MSATAPTASGVRKGIGVRTTIDHTGPVVVADDLTVAYTTRPGATPAVDG